MKPALFTLAFLTLAARALPAPDAVEITPDLLDRLQAEAEDRSPALQAAGARTESANAAVAAVRTWGSGARPRRALSRPRRAT